MKTKLLIKNFFVLLIFLYFTTINILACDCKVTEICSAYSRAEKVFVGKVKKVEYSNIVKVHFSVIKTYKGKTQKTEIVGFKDGGCLSIKFIEGREYFVYQDNSNSKKLCNRTTDLSSAKKEVEYAQSLSKTRLSYSIKGFISTGGEVSQDELKNTQIFISYGKTKKRVEIDKDGFFNYVVRKRGVYKVSILFPFPTEVVIENNGKVFENYIKTVNPNLSTLIIYNLQFQPNECDFRTVGVIRSK